ncbi:ATP-binding protein [Streptomyces sp. N2-109]|uniref:histidine kinase n=1 Tax=Streptomyces gossypii TaxID=2883101 RepID=A0ABT2JS98_9ACTN|nr:ATP-binding protein [Streptomyces gossypii]MCT2590759.1 ATP-binding protein [Streptomyces gossypii]
MVRAGTSTEVRVPSSAPIWLIPPALLGGSAVVALALVPGHLRAAVAWCGAAAVLVVALLAREAVRRGRQLAALRERSAADEAELRRRLAAQEAQAVRLAKELPAAVARLQEGALAEEALSGLVPGVGSAPELEEAHQAVLRSVLEAVEAEEGLRDSAQRAFVNIARRVQAIVHQQSQDLREMEDKHGENPDVFGDLLHLDHGTALIGRLADSIAVLGSARPGRQWQQDVPMFNVLRGAMSRIMDYRRIDLHSVAEFAVVGPAVEPLIHAVAELLDNATRYSPPQTRVHLTAMETQTGVAVEIEDAGIGLTDEARSRAERALAQASAGLDLNDLGETPRLGLAVVGRLSQANDFTVSLRPSAYGGVRAVLTVPQRLLTVTPSPGGQIARAATLPPIRPRPRPMTGPSETPAEELEAAVPRAANGLPQRRRHRAAAPPPARPAGAVPAPSAAGAAATAGPSEPPTEPGMWLAAFQSGVSAEPAAADPMRNGDEATSEGE